MNINLHITSRKNTDKKKKKIHRQVKLHGRQIPIYRKVPGSVK